jgi:hypothetical protein
MNKIKLATRPVQDVQLLNKLNINKIVRFGE